ncbi:MAG: hypothetical protein AB7O61_21170 [Acidimicrobiia bacterium]
MGVAAGALGLGVAGAVPAFASSGSLTAAAQPLDQAVDPVVAGLVYTSLDAFAFDTAQAASTPTRLYQEATGMQPSTAPAYIYAPLPIPIGSIVKQINVCYQVQPIISIGRRSFDGTFTDLTTPTSLAAGGGVKSQTLNVTAELTANASYSIKAFCSAGDSILGMTIGYIPPAQAFIPYTGASPRVFDSRTTTKFDVDEERTIDLSSHLIPTARAAVVNVTAAETEGGGFLAAFTDGITWPYNSTVNFAANQNIANAAIVTMTGGKIKVRCGVARAHVIVDVIGSLL